MSSLAPSICFLWLLHMTSSQACAGLGFFCRGTSFIIILPFRQVESGFPPFLPASPLSLILKNGHRSIIAGTSFLFPPLVAVAFCRWKGLSPPRLRSLILFFLFIWPGKDERSSDGSSPSFLVLPGCGGLASLARFVFVGSLVGVLGKKVAKPTL